MLVVLGDAGRVRRLRATTDDPRQAEALIEAAYLPNRIERLGPAPLDLRLDSLQLDTATVGLVSFGAPNRLVTSEAVDYHVNVPVQGRVVSRAAGGPATIAQPGQATIFMPDRPADIRWGSGASQVCLMIPARTLEHELEQLHGSAVTKPLVFASDMDLTAPAGRGWRATLDVLLAGLTGESSLLDHPRAVRQLERLVVDGLLLAQPHTYSEVLLRGGASAPAGPVGAARDLVEERPGEPWSTSTLARAVHVSVRSLQDGFARQLGVPPMAYLQQVRLRRARERLLESTPEETTVAVVAAELGLLHRGRFAAAYRREFGESPLDTLRRV